MKRLESFEGHKIALLQTLARKVNNAESDVCLTTFFDLG